MLSRFSLEGTPSNVTVGTEAWEDKDAIPGNGSLRYTNEGPTVLKRDARYYMMYSGGSWDLPTYALGYATTEAIPSEGLDGPGWDKVVPPILRSTPLVDAPGHNTVTKAPNNVDDITAYHARTVPFAGPGDRQTFVDRLYWLGARMHLDQPSLAYKPAPDRPLVGDLFNAASPSLGSGWNVLSGEWRQEDGVARQARTADGIALVNAPALNHYVFEANVLLAANKGRAGVVAARYDNGDRFDIWLDPARRALVTTGRVDGRSIGPVESRLDEDFRFDVFHQILISRDGKELQVTLDGVRMQPQRIPEGAARPGLATSGAAADFDGAAFTPFYEDFFSGPDSSWTTVGKGWMADEGAFHQVAGSAERYLALKGDWATDYEFEASVRFRDQESTASTAGIVAAWSDDGDLVLAGFDRTNWPAARFHVRHLVNGATRDSFAVPLPRGFQYDAFHTIRVVKEGSAFSFYLDGAETAAARFNVGEAIPGLYTEGVRAAFDWARMKWTIVPQNLLLNGSLETEQWEDPASIATNPWKVSGAASFNYCCAYSGLRRLAITGADGRAMQVVPDLARGSYSLFAFVNAREAEGVVTVDTPAGKTINATITGGYWQPVRIDFDLDQEGSVAVSLTGRFPGGDGLVAADDFLLVPR